MIIKPRIRGFICTTAHPVGCAAGVDEQIDFAQQHKADANGPKKVLVLGASGGYGLASRIVSAYGFEASTLGVSFERSPAENRTASAGWYNNRAFERRAQTDGLYAKSIDGDAFSDEVKAQVIETIRSDLGEIDLLVYSLASPVRQHPRTGILHRSSIKPLGKDIEVQTLHVDRGVVHDVVLEAADEQETANTVAVMGGEDWEFWIEALSQAGVLARGFKTVSFTYIGTELTWPIYWHATLGKAKEDLDRASVSIGKSLETIQGSSQVVVLKAVVTQASSAIPVVPLYNSLLFRVMKNAGVHENCIEHINRMFNTQLYSDDQRLDAQGRLRMDDLEVEDGIQNEINRLWKIVNTENLKDLADLDGYREDFLRIFGFGIAGVDYEADVDHLLAGDP